MKFHFLMSTERSGSNLITKLLDNHREICGPTPSHLIRAFAQNIHKYGNLENDHNWRILIGDMMDYLDCQLGEWLTSVNREEILNNITSRTLDEIIRYIYEKEAQEHRKKVVFIKENKIYNYLEFILRAFPESKFLYLVRDPRDMALSWKRSANHPGGVIQAAEIWKSDQKAYLEQVEQLRAQEQVELVTYEDLLKQTESSLKKIMKLFQLPYDPQMTNYYKNELTLKNADRLKDWDNLKKPVINQNYKKYKSGLSPEEIRYIESYCKDEMSQFGYKADFPDTGWKTLKKTLEEREGVFNGKARLTARERYLRDKRRKIIELILSRNLN